MGKLDARRAKTTLETLEEARKLRELWDSRSHPGQAEFGEIYEIGNQSAVGQFLRGVTPLSLKAAGGFAKGLRCRIEEFSPRLAASAADLAGLTSQSELPPDVASLAAAINSLPSPARERLISTISEIVAVVHEKDAHLGGNEIADDVTTRYYKVAKE